MSDFEDMMGTPIEVGDPVAVAFRLGNQAEMRLGVVTGYSSRNEYWTPEGGRYGRQPRPTILIEWGLSSGWWGNVRQSSVGNSWVYADSNRLVVLREPRDDQAG